MKNLLHSIGMGARMGMVFLMALLPFALLVAKNHAPTQDSLFATVAVFASVAGGLIITRKTYLDSNLK